MVKKTSILLDEYFENFINQLIKTGKYSSVSEVIRAALRMFEQEESRKAKLIKELEKGEQSGFVNDFDRDTFLESLHQRHIPE